MARLSSEVACTTVRWTRALANPPALLDVVVTPEAKSSDGKTGLAWVPDLQALGAWDEAERNWRQSAGHR